jgi:hypothetical protein
MLRMTLAEFIAACKAQSPSHDLIVFRCPMCATLQTARDLITAGAGADFDAVEKYLGFSCVGRFTDAGSPRKSPDGKPCNWTLGGLFSLHRMEVVTPDAKAHPRFELATREEADRYRDSMAMATGSASLVGLTQNDSVVSGVSDIDERVPVAATGAQEVAADLVDLGHHGSEHDHQAAVSAGPHAADRTAIGSAS